MPPKYLNKGYIITDKSLNKDDYIFQSQWTVDVQEQLLKSGAKVRYKSPQIKIVNSLCHFTLISEEPLVDQSDAYDFKLRFCQKFDLTEDPWDIFETDFEIKSSYFMVHDGLIVFEGSETCSRSKCVTHISIKKNLFSQDNTDQEILVFKFNFKFWFYGEDPNDFKNVACWRNNDLSTDFGKLLEDSETFDVKIVCDGKEEKVIGAHKLILGARSAVFKKMFETDMIESNKSRVEISDFLLEIVQKLLEFVYKGKIKYIDFKNGIELLKIGEKYQIEGLKEDCGQVIGSELDVENSVDALELADTYRAEDLKKMAVNFINENKKAIEVTEKFQNISKNLLMEIYLCADFKLDDEDPNDVKSDARRNNDLSADFGKLLEDSENFDVKIVCDGKEEQVIGAHKLVLGARSAVFKKMFETESNKSQVEISDFPLIIVQKLLEFMYKGKIKYIDFKNGIELLKIGEKYQIEGLKEDCGQVIGSELNVENSVDALELADTYRAEDLKKMTINFINENKKAVEVTEKFQNISKNLLMEIYLCADLNLK